jgi:hypothetical protein
MYLRYTALVVVSIGPQIEALRIGGKSKIRDAATVQDVDIEFKATVQSLQAVTP